MKKVIGDYGDSDVIVSRIWFLTFHVSLPTKDQDQGGFKSTR
jgi:hypothetical protein